MPAPPEDAPPPFIEEGQRTFTRAFRHVESSDGAGAMVTILEKGPRAPRIVGRSVNFVTRLAEGPELVTTDNAEPEVFTPPARRRTVKIPGGPEMATLMVLVPRSSSRSLPVGGRAAKALSSDMAFR